MRTSFLCSALALLFVAPAASAQSYAPGAKPSVDEEPAYVESPAPSRGGYGYAPRSNDHTGVMVRLALGVGVGAIAQATGDLDTSYRGGAGLTSIAIGGAVSPNFALGADFFGFGLNDPEVYIDDTRIGYAGSNTTYRMNAVGLNGTYYVMPANVYLSGSLGFGVNSVTRYSGYSRSYTTSRSTSDAGLAAAFMVGKEWKASREWGLGVAGQFMLASSKDSENANTRYGNAAFGVLFSATYF
jgi:hypothetical protein